MSVLMTVPKNVLLDLLKNWLTKQDCTNLDDALLACENVDLLTVFDMASRNSSTYHHIRRNRRWRDTLLGRNTRELEVTDATEDSIISTANNIVVTHLHFKHRETLLSNYINECREISSLELFHSRLTVDDAQQIYGERLKNLTSLSISGICVTNEVLGSLQGKVQGLLELSVLDNTLPTMSWCNFIQWNTQLKYLLLDNVESAFVLQTVMNNCTDMQSIELYSVSELMTPLIVDFIGCCKALQRLSVNFNHESSRILLSFTPVGNSLSRTASVLELHGLLAAGTASELLAIGGYEAVTLVNVTQSWRCLGRLLLSKNSLTRLYIDNISWIGGKELREVLLLCTHIRVLSLCTWQMWADDDFVVAFQDPVNISEVDLLCNLNLCTKTVVKIVRKCPKLVKCNVYGSTKVDVALLKEEDMNVEYRNEQPFYW